MTLPLRRVKDFPERDRRMKEAFLFILAGEHNAASLARKLGISVPTASRLVEVLKGSLARRGRRLVSVRTEGGFHYEVRDDERARRIQRDPLVTFTLPAGSRRRQGLKAEDRDLYDRD